MKPNFFLALFLLTAAATNGCQEATPAAGPSPATAPALTPPSRQPAEPATTQPSVTEAGRRLLWWGSDAPAAQAAQPEMHPSSRPSATVSLPGEQ